MAVPSAPRFASNHCLIFRLLILFLRATNDAICLKGRFAHYVGSVVVGPTASGVARHNREAFTFTFLFRCSVPSRTGFRS